MNEIENRLASNLGDVLANGPGLRIRERQGGGSWIAAKDTVNGYVYLSGLGGMGVGSMWFPMHGAHVHEDGSRTPATSEDPTYDDGPDVLTENGNWDRRIIDPELARLAYARTAAGMMTQGMKRIDVEIVERPT